MVVFPAVLLHYVECPACLVCPVFIVAEIAELQDVRAGRICALFQCGRPSGESAGLLVHRGRRAGRLEELLSLLARELNINPFPIHRHCLNYVAVPISWDWICYRSHVSP